MLPIHLVTNDNANDNYSQNFSYLPILENVAGGMQDLHFAESIWPGVSLSSMYMPVAQPEHDFMVVEL
jgi:hypothetical protein